MRRVFLNCYVRLERIIFEENSGLYSGVARVSRLALVSENTEPPKGITRERLSFIQFFIPKKKKKKGRSELSELTPPPIIIYLATLAIPLKENRERTVYSEHWR